MKSKNLIIFLLLFGLLNSCIEKSENDKLDFIENKLFGKVKSVETKTFENDTLKLIELKFYNKKGNIEKSRFSFEPNLSNGEIIFQYNRNNKLEREIIISDGDTTNVSLYYYNNLGLLKKEDYYENKLHSITNFKLDSSGKIKEKDFKYVNSDGLRTFKFYYQNSFTTIIKEFLKGNLDITTETRIYPRENKKEILRKRKFPESEYVEIFYYNNNGYLIKKEKIYNGEIKEIENFTYKLDSEKNWIESGNGRTQKKREIIYY